MYSAFFSGLKPSMALWEKAPLNYKRDYFRPLPSKHLDGVMQRRALNSIPRQLSQQYMVVTAKLRLPALVAFLVARIKAKERTVIFMTTCDVVDYMYALFTELTSIFDNTDDDENNEESKGIFGHHCGIYRLHGNVPRDERHTILNEFGADLSHASVLFATDGTCLYSY